MLRVLLLEDHDDTADTLYMILTRWGYQCDVARDGETAIELATIRRPDVALLDLGLPGIDGWETCKRLRESCEGIAIFAVTGYGREQDIARSQDAGFDGHLLKPVDLDYLHSLLESEPGSATDPGPGMEISRLAVWNHLCGMVRRSASQHDFLLPSQADRFGADAHVFCDMPAPQSDRDLGFRRLVWDKLLESWGRVLADAGQRPVDDLIEASA
jgi:CheY-like chemotaxis protein